VRHAPQAIPYSQIMADHLDVESIRAEYGKVLRAWHVAWTARVEWHRTHFYPFAQREQELLYDYSAARARRTPSGEEKASDGLAAARDVLAETLRTLGAG